MIPKAMRKRQVPLRLIAGSALALWTSSLRSPARVVSSPALNVRLSPSPLLVREGSAMNVAATICETFLYLPGGMFRWDEEAAVPLLAFETPGLVRGRRAGTTRLVAEPNFSMPSRAELRKLLDVEVLPARPFPANPAKEVVAAYYPWFSERYAPPTPRPRACELWSAYTPTLKPYDPQSEEALAQHIRMAKDGGLDAFAVSWFTNRLTFDFSYEELFTPCLAALARLAPRLGFKVHILYESHMNLLRWDGGWIPLKTAQDRERARRDAEADIRFLLGQLSPVEDEPAFFVYLAEAVGLAPEDWGQVFAAVRRDYPQARFYADTYNLDYVAAFDGLFDYGACFYESLMNQFASLAIRVKDYGPAKRFYATAGPGFDSRLYWGPSALLISRAEGSYYRQTWERALAARPDGVFITSWNEWGESTMIEPSKQYGYTYLDITADGVIRLKTK
jgi:hypothetical protein